MEVGKREIIYLSLHCHHQNDSCIKTGSDDSHFNVSLIVMEKVTRLPRNHNLSEERGEPKRNRTEGRPSAYQPNALMLGQTGSPAQMRSRSMLNTGDKVVHYMVRRWRV